MILVVDKYILEIVILIFIIAICHAVNPSMMRCTRIASSNVICL